MANEFILSSIGTRGLVIFDGDKYSFVQEKKWRSKGALNAPPEELPVQEMADLNVVVAELAQTGAYIDLDRLGELEDPSDSTEGVPTGWTGSPPNIVLREKGKFYQISRNDWQDVPPGFEGDAGVLVKRGTVVAAIPQNSIPSGTYCVLVNLASLKST